MGYSAETNDINFSSGTTALYGFLGFLINGESTNGSWFIGVKCSNAAANQGLLHRKVITA
jgi:hypothetical protein